MQSRNQGRPTPNWVTGSLSPGSLIQRQKWQVLSNPAQPSPVQPSSCTTTQDQEEDSRPLPISLLHHVKCSSAQSLTLWFIHFKTCAQVLSHCPVFPLSIFLSCFHKQTLWNGRGVKIDEQRPGSGILHGWTVPADRVLQRGKHPLQNSLCSSSLTL